MTEAGGSISHYRLETLLGSGAMGAVYRGVDKRDGSLVAVKLLHRHLAEDPSFRERFEQEAHVAALLRSPYTVQVIEFGVDGGRCFIAMEYVHGQTLKALLVDGPLPPERATRIGVQVARALEEAEARGIVHRDIKPENILVRTGDAIKVTDFGLARHASAAALTGSGLIAGTLAYAAPEQLTGEADNRSDIYALGATLYYMLAGAPPFTGNLGEVAQRVRSEPPPEAPLHDLQQPELADVVLRCLEKDPGDRFQAASGLAAALADVLETNLAATDDGTLPLGPPRPSDTIALQLIPQKNRRLFAAKQYRLSVRNETEQPAAVNLHVDEDGECDVRLPEVVAVGPRSTATIAVSVRPLRRRWRGPSVTRIFSITGSTGGGEPPVAVSGRFSDEPYGWRPVAILLGVGGAVAIAAAAGFAAVSAIGTLSSDNGSAEETASELVAEGYVPKLEPAECPAETLDAEPASTCESLVVPEDRSDPDGRQARVLLVTTASTAEDPGVPTVVVGASVPVTTGSLRSLGDVVLLGLREHFADPPLHCPEMIGPSRVIWSRPSGDPEANAQWLAGAEACGKRLVAEGANLDAYGLSDYIDDLRDLLIAKRWTKVKLLSRDFFTQVAAHFAERYPASVRAMVMEDVYPPDVRVTWNNEATWSGITEYVAACESDTRCAAAYPDLLQQIEDKFYYYQEKRQVFSRSDPDGGPDFQVMVDGAGAAAALDAVLNDPSVLPALASLIAADHDATAETIATYVLDFWLADVSGNWLAANWSQFCEDKEYLNRAAAVASAVMNPLFEPLATAPEWQLCDRWPTEQRSDVIGRTRVPAAVPVLVLGGQISTDSPPAYAEAAAARSFEDATIAIFPRLTTNPSFNGPACVLDLRLAFLEDPDAELDIEGCKAQVPPIDFVGADGGPAEDPSP
jgi:serine/threonine protein kinase/pimeloyl-ACP methyl ester carboxylesterase